MCFVLFNKVFAQVRISKDSLASVGLSIPIDSTKKKDSIQVKTKKDIQTTIKYNAQDSMKMDVRKKLVYMYRDATIDYGDISLKANTIDINWGNNLVNAKGTQDSLGKKLGEPEFKQGSETYTSNQIKYNFKTKKGLISGLVTKQGEGYIHGEHVMRKNNMMYIDHAHYTTCNLAHPHFYINASKLKLIPDKKIVAGPFNMVFADIKTPIGFFLGFFPVPKKNKSGIIFPTYGENANGFFLTRGGYYWAVSDHIGMQFTGDYFTKGNHGLQVSANYKKRYKYGGNASLEYFNFISQTALERTSNKNYRFTWNHSTENKGTSSLSANVAISSAGYNKVATFNVANRFSNDFRSSVSYRKTFKGTPFSLNVSLNQSQNVNTKLMTFSGLPDVNFVMNRIFPFKNLSKGTGKKWYEQMYKQFNLVYTMSARMTFSNGYNRVDSIGNITRIDSGLVLNSFNQIGYLIKGGEYFKIRDSLYANNEFNKGEKILLNGSQYGARHSIPLSTSIKVLKYFSLNPSFTLNEYWLPRSLEYKPSDTIRSVYQSETIDGFARAWGWSTGGTSLRTMIYGTYQFKKSKLMGIRHIMTPSITYSYSPDLTNPSYGGFQQIYKTNGEELLDKAGNPVRVSSFTAGNQFAPGGGRASSSIRFDLINTFEAKIRTQDTAKPTKKFPILDNLSFGSQYDLLADNFQLSNFVLNARTNIKDGRLLISFNSTFDPYAYQVNTKATADKYGNLEYQRTKDFAYDKGQGFFNMKDANITASTSLNPQTFKKAKTNSETNKTKSEQEKYVRANPDMYVDFNVPWSINLSYQMNLVGNYFLYRINQNFDRNSNITANSLNINGDISLTEKWKITYSTSYDLKRKLFPQLSMGIIRDLHCWAMSMNIVRFNNDYTFFFNINAKSSLLQDLKLTKRSPNLLNQAGF
ncbi:MAG: LPS-assembly protein LptD [Cytophagales bacterium]|nr:MAG: LPS-assembly protein LptD [Cytophagales bacterium]